MNVFVSVKVETINVDISQRPLKYKLILIEFCIKCVLFGKVWKNGILKQIEKSCKDELMNWMCPKYSWNWCFDSLRVIRIVRIMFSIIIEFCFLFFKCGRKV